MPLRFPALAHQEKLRAFVQSSAIRTIRWCGWGPDCLRVGADLDAPVAAPMDGGGSSQPSLRDPVRV